MEPYITGGANETNGMSRGISVCKRKLNNSFPPTHLVSHVEERHMLLLNAEVSDLRPLVWGRVDTGGVVRAA